MSKSEIIIYGLISFWFVVVIVHALTRCYCTPILNVVEVKEIIRTPFEAIEFKDDFIIDEREMRFNPPQNIVEKYLFQSADRLFKSLPKDVFEIIEWPEDYRQMGRRFTFKINVLPPLKR